MKQSIIRLVLDESGQDLVEYGLIVGLIGLGLIVSMSSMQHNIANLFSAVSNRLSNMA
jgi:pilus assembly protein Flp/PilA